VVAPNPHAPQAPFFNSELAMVKAYQGQYDSARQYLDRAGRLFGVPEDKIPYPSYFLAAGHGGGARGIKRTGVDDYAVAYKMGGMEGVHLMPSELYYAHGLILTGRLDEAERILEKCCGRSCPRVPILLLAIIITKHYAELLKAKGGIMRGMEGLWRNVYSIKDSLTKPEPLPGDPGDRGESAAAG
jgi:hypothetical protein